MRSFVLIIFFIPTLFISGKIRSQDNGKKTFSNPLLPSGADPYSFYKDGYYYYTNTLGNRIGLWKTKSLADLKNATHKTIYEPPEGTMYSKQLWAPEIMFIEGKWYAYFAADDGNNNNHRMYVLENASPDPMGGEWIFKGKIADPSDKWTIDGDVFEYKEQWYMIWSGDLKKELCPGAYTAFFSDFSNTGSADFSHDWALSRSSPPSKRSNPRA